MTKAYPGGLPDGTIDITFTQLRWQSASARSFRVASHCGCTATQRLPRQGLSGGRIVVGRPTTAPTAHRAEDGIIGGNVILFGATSGKAFLRGAVGERFAVRNSGAIMPWSRASATTVANT